LIPGREDKLEKDDAKIKRKKSKKEEPQPKTQYELALDQVKEYCLVKDMLINNSLPIADGRYDSNKGNQVFSRQLIIDKKILLNLLIDL